MKLKYFLFLAIILFISCEKDKETNSNSENPTETTLTVESAIPVADAVISINDDYSFEMECLIAETDYDASATYELQVYLSGESNSSYVDCGNKTITVTANEKTSQSINGQLLIAPGHNSPYTIEVNLYKYENGSGTPFSLASATISYQ